MPWVQLQFKKTALAAKWRDQSSLRAGQEKTLRDESAMRNCVGNNRTSASMAAHTKTFCFSYWMSCLEVGRIALVTTAGIYSPLGLDFIVVLRSCIVCSPLGSIDATVEQEKLEGCVLEVPWNHFHIQARIFSCQSICYLLRKLGNVVFRTWTALTKSGPMNKKETDK